MFLFSIILVVCRLYYHIKKNKSFKFLTRCHKNLYSKNYFFFFFPIYDIINKNMMNINI